MGGNGAMNTLTLKTIGLQKKRKCRTNSQRDKIRSQTGELPGLNQFKGNGGGATMQGHPHPVGLVVHAPTDTSDRNQCSVLRRALGFGRLAGLSASPDGLSQVAFFGTFLCVEIGCEKFTATRGGVFFSHFWYLA